MARYDFDPMYNAEVFMDEHERRIRRLEAVRLARYTGRRRKGSPLDLSGLIRRLWGRSRPSIAAANPAVAGRRQS